MRSILINEALNHCLPCLSRRRLCIYLISNWTGIFAATTSSHRPSGFDTLGPVTRAVNEGHRVATAKPIRCGLGRLPSGIERIEVLFEAVLGGFPRVDGAAEKLALISRHRAPRRNKPSTGF